MEPIIDNLDKVIAYNTRSQIDSLRLEKLLPTNIDKYYRYPGSLTTPGCDEVVDWFVVHEPILTISDEHSCEKASQYLKNKGVQNVINTLGSKGAYLSSEAFSGMINTIEFNVVDTTGAGDAFNGSIAFALSQDMNLESAVRYANLVAGLSVTKLGAQASVPYPSELEMELKNVKSF